MNNLILFAVLPKLIYYLYVLSIKIPVGFFPPQELNKFMKK